MTTELRPHSQSRFTTALVRALAPLPPDIDRGTEKQILSDVGGFLEAQLADLPLRLRLALRVGLTCVAALSWLRYGAALATLDVPRQRRFVESLAYGRLFAFRALFRPLRANVLLAFFDHPLLEERRAAPELIRLHAG